MLKIQENLIYNIKFNRKKLKITQEQLAELCDVSANYIGRVEIGYHFPSADMLEKLAKVFQIKPYMLFIDPEELNNFTKADIKLKKELIIDDLIKEIKKTIKKVVNKEKFNDNKEINKIK